MKSTIDIPKWEIGSFSFLFYSIVDIFKKEKSFEPFFVPILSMPKFRYYFLTYIFGSFSIE